MKRNGCESWAHRCRGLCLLGAAFVAGCGTLTGLPSHGGGKRFATEQRLVSASVRASLKELDLSPLRGKRAALVFDLVADEGAGTLQGGRWTPGLVLSAGNIANPITNTYNAFQVYGLQEVGSNYSNGSSGGSSSTVGTTLQNGTSTTDTTSSSTTETASSSTSTGSSSGTTVTSNTGSSSGSSTSTTGGISTNTHFNQTENSSSTSTTTGSSSNSTNSNTTSTTNGHSNSTTQSSSTSNSNTATNSSGTHQTTGGQNNSRETLTPSPSSSVSHTRGNRRENSAALQYRGLGEYQNFSVPKSDASLLMGLTRNYFMLNGVIPTTPNDPTADLLVYITVDIFGTVRSRFDAFAYNNETVKAETSFEVMAFDREGRNVMRPQVANHEAQYREHYLFWVGPVTTREKVQASEGLLVDFKDVSAVSTSAATRKEAETQHPFGKN